MKELKSLIGDGKQIEALSILEERLPAKSTFHNHLIILKNRLNRIEERKILGLSSSRDLDIDYNEFLHSFLLLIDRIQDVEGDSGNLNAEVVAEKYLTDKFMSLLRQVYYLVLISGGNFKEHHEEFFNSYLSFYLKDSFEEKGFEFDFRLFSKNGRKEKLLLLINEFLEEFEDENYLLVLLQLLYEGIAIDGIIYPEQEELLVQIKESLNLPESHYELIEKNVTKSITYLRDCLNELSVTEDSSIIDIKRNFRKLVKSYHPDKFEHSGLPSEIQYMIREKFQFILFSYNTILSTGQKTE